MTERFRTLAEGLDHPEALVWSPQGGRIFAGGESGQIYAIELAGTYEEIANTGGFVLGMAIDGGGSIFVCDSARKEVVRIDLNDGAVECYSSGARDRTMRTPNYLAFDPDGSLYVTDSGEWKADDGVVFRVTRSGETEIWTRSVPRFTNGCCLSPDTTALYVVESLGPTVSRIPILPDGSAGQPTTILQLPGAVPDGIAFDCDGRLYVSCYRPDRIYRMTANGDVDVLADDPQGIILSAPTNLAFVGQNLDLLAVANLGGYHVAVADIGAVGARLQYPRVDQHEEG